MNKSISAPPSPDRRSRKIYAVDDDLVIGLMVKAILEAEGHQAETFHDGSTLIEKLKNDPADLILTDLDMPGIRGFELLEQIRSSADSTPVIVMTGSAELEDAVKALRLGASDYLVKPLNPDRVVAAVQRTLQIRDLEELNKAYFAELSRANAIIEEELRMARDIQNALLPRGAPVLPGFRFGITFVPSRTIGGDFYDYVRFIPGESIGILLSDISGHGVPAALLFCLFKAITSEIFLENRSAPECFALLNRRISSIFPDSRFASTTYLAIDARMRTCEFVKASQEPILLIREGSARIFENGAPLLGAFDPEMFGDPDYVSQRIELKTGDLIVLYTDGIVEIENSAGEQLGISRLIEWLLELQDTDPQALTETILARAMDFSHKREIADDFTILAIKVE